MFQSNLGEKYSPLYFLASLGAGGLSITFFLYPMFLIDHPGFPLVTFDHIEAFLAQASPLLKGLLLADLLAVALFALLHFVLLAWNFRELKAFRHSQACDHLKGSNAEVSLMAIPLTLAMSINVAFVLGALFVPGLWDRVEYLFPLALLGFLAVGVFALRILGRYFLRLFTRGEFDFAANNNLSQMVAIFALGMIAVGFAAPGAMSHIKVVNALGVFFAIFFLSLALLLMMLKLILGFQSILKHGIALQSSPSLWIMIPILTLFGITAIRILMALHHGFDAGVSMPGFFVLTSILLSLQLAVGMLGYLVMKRLGYFDEFVRGPRRDAGSFALICPGVALFVFGMFFVNFGLVKNGLIDPLSPALFIAMAPLIWLQVKTIQVFFRLTCKLMAFGPCSLRPVAQH